MPITRSAFTFLLALAAVPCLAGELKDIPGAQPWPDECCGRAKLARRIGGNVKPPVVKKRVEAKYPDTGTPRAEMGARGIAIFEVIIDSRGEIPCARVLKFTVLKPSPEVYDAALHALRQWKFTPSTLNGEPVEVVINLTQNF